MQSIISCSEPRIVTVCLLFFHTIFLLYIRDFLAVNNTARSPNTKGNLVVFVLFASF